MNKIKHPFKKLTAIIIWLMFIIMNLSGCRSLDEFPGVGQGSNASLTTAAQTLLAEPAPASMTTSGGQISSSTAAAAPEAEPPEIAANTTEGNADIPKTDSATSPVTEAGTAAESQAEGESEAAPNQAENGADLENNDTSPVETAEVPEDTVEVPDDMAESDYLILDLSDIWDLGTLRLVDNGHQVTEVSSDELAGYGDYLLRSDIRWILAAFVEDLADNGVDSFLLSGFRDEAEQREIYESAAETGYANEPGGSEHQTGLAVDMHPDSVTGTSQSQLTSDISLMHDLGAEYGFIERYPEGKEWLTGISYEYWHLRYVGYPHSGFMYQADMVLEEYLDYLQANGTLEIGDSSSGYIIDWQEPSNGGIRIRPGMDYEISSTNTGSFIVTYQK